MNDLNDRLSASDEELVNWARSGDSASLDSLWERYRRRIFLFVRRKVATEQDAEDLVSETFIKMMRYLDRFDTRYRFSSWLYTLCNQLVVSHYRRRKMESLPDDLPQCAEGPAEEAESNSMKERLWQAAARLPKKQYDVIWLRYVEDLPVAEVARALSISGINARVLLHRARLALVRAVAEVNAKESGAQDGYMAEVTP